MDLVLGSKLGTRTGQRELSFCTWGANNARTAKPSFLGLRRLMKALRDRVSAEVQQPYAGRCTPTARRTGISPIDSLAVNDRSLSDVTGEANSLPRRTTLATRTLVMSICVTHFVAFGSHRTDTETDPPQRALRMESSPSFFASFVLFVPAVLRPHTGPSW